MNIRRATHQDANTLSDLNTDVQKLHADAYPRLFKPVSSNPFPPSFFEELLAQPEHVFFIAEEDGIPIGYIYMEIRHSPETSYRFALETIHIHHISVRPGRRRKGYGEELMEAAISLAREKNIQLITLDVWSFNTGAQAFFARQGFTVYNQRMWLTLSKKSD